MELLDYQTDCHCPRKVLWLIAFHVGNACVPSPIVPSPLCVFEGQFMFFSPSPTLFKQFSGSHVSWPHFVFFNAGLKKKSQLKSTLLFLVKCQLLRLYWWVHPIWVLIKLVLAGKKKLLLATYLCSFKPVFAGRIYDLAGYPLVSYIP